MTGGGALDETVLQYMQSREKRRIYVSASISSICNKDENDTYSYMSLLSNNRTQTHHNNIGIRWNLFSSNIFSPRPTPLG